MKKLIIWSLFFSIGILHANELKQQISIYGWLPTFDATMRFKIPNHPAGESGDKANANVLNSLDAVFMGSYELRKEKWSFLSDFIYLKVSGDTRGINPDVTLDLALTGKIYGFYGGYNIFQTNKNDINAIAGMRYFGLGLNVKRSGGKRWNGTLSPSVDTYDAIVGLKGRYSIDKSWNIPYQFDIGTGDSDLTWQASVSIAYQFDWGDIIATYRYLHYDKKESFLIKDFDLYGPKVGVVFHF